MANLKLFIEERPVFSLDSYSTGFIKASNFMSFQDKHKQHFIVKIRMDRIFWLLTYYVVVIFPP